MKIDVLMPTFNGEKTIARAIESVPKNWRVIVFDDGSTDNVCEVACRYPNTEVHRRSENKGVGHTLNQLYDLCDADYYVQLSDDDYLYPAIEEVAKQLGKHDLVFFDMVNDNGKRWSMNESNVLKYSQSVKFIRRKTLGDIRTDGSHYKEDVYVMNELLKKNPTMLFTGILAKHYTHPKPGSLSYRGRRKELKPNHDIKER